MPSLKVQALLKAAQKGDIPTLEALLKKPAEEGFSVNSVDEKGFTALHYAAWNGHLEAVKCLLAYEADYKACDSQLWLTPLHVAAACGHTAIAECLLSRAEEMQDKQYINARTETKVTVLHIAADTNQEEIIRFLLEQSHIQKDAKAFDDVTSLHIAVKQKAYEALLALLAAGADPNIADKAGNTPLHLAALRVPFDYRLVKILVEHNNKKGISNPVDQNCKNHAGDTPLLILMKRKETYCGWLLLCNPSLDVNLADNSGFSPLHVAAENGFYKGVISLLQRKDSNLHAVTLDNENPLLIACKNGHEAIVHAILHFSCSVEKSQQFVALEDKKGDTALTHAIRTKKSSLITMFLKHPSSKHYSNKQFEHAFEAAIQVGEEVVDTLFKQGEHLPGINAYKEGKISADSFYYATYLGRFEILHYLVQLYQKGHPELSMAASTLFERYAPTIRPLVTYNPFVLLDIVAFEIETNIFNKAQRLIEIGKKVILSLPKPYSTILTAISKGIADGLKASTLNGDLDLSSCLICPDYLLPNILRVIMEYSGKGKFVLNLAHNQLFCSGIAMVGEFLCTFKTIIALDLTDNLLEHDPWRFETFFGRIRVDWYLSDLAKALEDPELMLEHLTLAHNYLRDYDIACLAKGLAKNAKLNKLNLAHNSKLTDKTIDYLLEALKTNTTLEEVCLTGCDKITLKKKEQLQARLQQNRKSPATSLSGLSNSSTNNPLPNNTPAFALFHTLPAFSLQEWYRQLKDASICDKEDSESFIQATSVGLHHALEHILGDSVIIIHPEACSVASPLDTDKEKRQEGAYHYAKVIAGYTTADKTYHFGVLEKSKRLKPIVMLINTQSARIQNSRNGNVVGGYHWVACVYIPQGYQPPIETRQRISDEKIYFIDPLHPEQTLPGFFEKLLLEGGSHCFKTAEGQTITHTIPAAFPQAKGNRSTVFVNLACQQQRDGTYDCGWWSFYNAVMLVLTGNANYLNTFQSPQSAFRLRQLLPTLSYEVPQSVFLQQLLIIEQKLVAIPLPLEASSALLTKVETAKEHTTPMEAFVYGLVKLQELVRGYRENYCKSDDWENKNILFLSEFIDGFKCCLALHNCLTFHPTLMEIQERLQTQYQALRTNQEKQDLQLKTEEKAKYVSKCFKVALQRHLEAYWLVTYLKVNGRVQLEFEPEGKLEYALDIIKKLLPLGLVGLAGVSNFALHTATHSLGLHVIEHIEQFITSLIEGIKVTGESWHVWELLAGITGAEHAISHRLGLSEQEKLENIANAFTHQEDCSVSSKRIANKLAERYAKQLQGLSLGEASQVGEFVARIMISYFAAGQYRDAKDNRFKKAKLDELILEWVFFQCWYQYELTGNTSLLLNRYYLEGKVTSINTHQLFAYPGFICEDSSKQTFIFDMQLIAPSDKKIVTDGEHWGYRIASAAIVSAYRDWLMQKRSQQNRIIPENPDTVQLEYVLEKDSEGKCSVIFYPKNTVPQDAHRLKSIASTYQTPKQRLAAVEDNMSILENRVTTLEQENEQLKSTNRELKEINEEFENRLTLCEELLGISAKNKKEPPNTPLDNPQEKDMGSKQTHPRLTPSPTNSQSASIPTTPFPLFKHASPRNRTSIPPAIPKEPTAPQNRS